MTDKNTEESSPEVSDPVVDLMVLQAENAELKVKVNELEFMASAMGDQMRLNLMNHLMPYYLPKKTTAELAITEAHKVADQCVSILEEKFEKKAAEYQRRLTEIQAGHNPDEETEN